VLSYIIPNPFYVDGYVYVARVVSGIFLLLQIVIFIDFAIQWNKDWRDKRNCTSGLVVISLLLYAVSIVALALMYVYYGGAGCDLEKFFISFTLVFTFIFSVISITDLVPHGALLPSSVVTLYMYYVLFSALGSDPSKCNTTSSSEAAHLAIGLVIAAASITYAGWSIGNSNSLFGAPDAPVDDQGKDGEDASFKAVEQGEAGKEEAKSAKAPEADKASAPTAKAAAPVAEKSEKEQEEEAAANSKRNAKFHFVMAAASMYMAMLLTSWGSQQELSGQTDVAYDLNLQSMWIKIVSQWCTGLLYTWTLAAPYLFPDREFGHYDP